MTNKEKQEAEELDGANNLKQYLESLGNSVSFERGGDPPDFVFRVNGEKWAVEHTELHRYIAEDGQEVSAKGVELKNKRTIEKINQTTQCRKHGYQIAIVGDFDAKYLKQVEQKFIDFIREDDSLNKPKDQLWLKDDIEHIGIFRSTLNDNRILPFYGISSFNMNPQGNPVAYVKSTIEYAIERCLTDKQTKLLKLGNDFKQKVLLINVHEYWYSDCPEEYFLNFLKNKLFDGIDLIYIYNGKNICWVYQKKQLTTRSRHAPK